MPFVEDSSRNKFVEKDVYWTLVGMIRDSYSHTTDQHIDAIKEFINEDRTDDWYSKLYKCVRRTVGSVIHEDMTVGESTAVLTIPLLPNVLLVGKPDIVEEDRVIELKTRRQFVDSILESEKVQVHCYMKLTGKRHAVVREIVGDETKDTDIEWDDIYWDRIYRTIIVILEWL
jgi:hypothetical protein